jgi:hypothetical protein
VAGHAQHHTLLIEKAEGRTAETGREQGHTTLDGRAEIHKALAEQAEDRGNTRDQAGVREVLVEKTENHTAEIERVLGQKM